MPRPSVEIIGERELKRLMRELPPNVQKKGCRAAVTAGSTPVMRAARAGAPRDQGLLKKAIGRKVKTYKSGVAAAIIGAKRSVQGVTHTSRGTRKQIPALYINLVAKGTKAHEERLKTGQVIHHPGARAQPFLEEAWNANREKAATAAKSKLAEVTEKEARKLGKL